jgi:nucleoside 2-deoxyribosyltransferase
MGQTVCLCGSFRHWAELVAFRDALLASGAACEWPRPELRRDPETMSGAEASVAILSHLDRIDRADRIFVYDKDGYVGRSVAMDIGYAFARRKPLYALTPIPDPFLQPLVTAVVSAEVFLAHVRSGNWPGIHPLDRRAPSG